MTFLSSLIQDQMLFRLLQSILQGPSIWTSSLQSDRPRRKATRWSSQKRLKTHKKRPKTSQKATRPPSGISTWMTASLRRSVSVASFSRLRARSCASTSKRVVTFSHLRSMGRTPTCIFEMCLKSQSLLHLTRPPKLRVSKGHNSTSRTLPSR